MRRMPSYIVGVAVLGFVSSVCFADVGPPVKIKFAANPPQAVSGQEYRGAFEVHVSKPGTLANFRISGDGWTILEVEPLSDPMNTPVGVVLIPFRAVPAEADNSIGLSLTYNGRKVVKSYEIGPAYFARAGAPGVLERMGDSRGLREGPAGDRAAVEDDGGRAASRGMAPRGGLPPSVTVVGRLVYARPDGRTVGADHIYVEVRDEDPVDHNTMWSGFTDREGYFDSGPLSTDVDGDGSGPDLVLYAETYREDWVDVTDHSLEEWTYWFESEEITDYEEDFFDFGWRAPTTNQQAFHLYTSTMRLRRFIRDATGLYPPEIQVIWPSDESGTLYKCDWEEIHVVSANEWHEDVLAHEYGHHFECQIAAGGVVWDVDYCNGNCDVNPGAEQCGHCLWCAENNESDAWHEGFADWLGGAATRFYPQEYTFDDGCAYEPSIRGGYNFMAPQMCSCPMGQACDDLDTFTSALTTEGYVGLLLRDIEDDVVTDCLAESPGQILTLVVTGGLKNSVRDFISYFGSVDPLRRSGLWKTAYNVDPVYVEGTFPEDSSAPDAPTEFNVWSPTHPLGVGGRWPCVTVAWSPPFDDVTGAHGYSFIWSSSPSGAEPDLTVDVEGTCAVSVPGPPIHPGEGIYLRIRAQDFVGNWGPSSDWFGPFVVTAEECPLRDNGVPDLCDINCNVAQWAIACEIPADPFDFCASYASCGQAGDCNANGEPDDCDLAGGASQDCNQDGVPDECSPLMRFWVTPGGGSWHEDDNWDSGPPPPVDECAPPPPPSDPGVPDFPDQVCIPSGSPVTYSVGYTHIVSLSSDSDFSLNGPAFPWPDLELDGPAFINGDLAMSGTSTLTVNGTLDVAGMLSWASRTIRGPGQTNVAGGFELLSGTSELRGGHHLTLSGGPANINDQSVSLNDTSIFTIGEDVIYDFQGEGTPFNANIFAGGTTTTVDIQGTLVRSSGEGRAVLQSNTNNSGLIHVQTGELYMGYSGTHSGGVLGDPGTLLSFANGDYEWLPGSSLIGDDVTFSAGSVSPGSIVRGDVNIAGTLTVGNPSFSTVTFTDEANVTSFGQELYARAGTVRFESPAAPAVDFDSVIVGQGNPYGGSPYFDTGEPVVIHALQLVFGGIYGADPITINDSFTWTGGSFFAGGDVTCNAPVTIQSTSSARYLSRVFNNAEYATFLGSIGPSGAGVFNNLATGTVDLQGDSTGLTSGSSTNAGLIVKSAGAGRSTLSGMNNSGLIHAQTGEIYFYFGGENSGDILGDPGTLLTFNLTHEMPPGSSLTGDDVTFFNSTSNIRGGVNIAGTLTVDGGTVTFTDEAEVTSYGQELYARAGTVRFESPVVARSVDFDSVTVGQGSPYCGSPHFDTGEPVVINALHLVCGSILGTDPITISDSFTWNSGSFLAGGDVTNNGDAVVQSTGSTRNLSRDFYNAGTFTFQLGAINLSNADFHNLPTGIIDIRTVGAAFGLSTTSTLYNDGALFKSAGSGPSLINNHFRNAGLVEVQTGALELYGGYALTHVQTAGQTVLNGGDLILTAGAAYQMLGGDLTGVGTVSGLVDNVAGTVKPGLSAGVLTIDGDHTQGASAKLTIEIGGTAQGADYDWLEVTGTATLAGELEVELINGFVPGGGEAFTVVTAAPVSGAFDTVTLTGFPPGAQVQVIYTADSVLLQVEEPIPGDCDGDGDVDAVDFGNFADCLLGPGGGLGAGCACFDSDADGDITLFDFGEFQVSFTG